MTIIKKTIVIHPEMDALIRRAWAKLIEKGYDASYSTALHFVLAAGIYAGLIALGHNEKAAYEYVTQKYLSNEKIKELNTADAMIKFMESLYPKNKTETA
jgi:hypothetical protein